MFVKSASRIQCLSLLYDTSQNLTSRFWAHQNQLKMRQTMQHIIDRCHFQEFVKWFSRVFFSVEFSFCEICALVCHLFNLSQFGQNVQNFSWRLSWWYSSTNITIGKETLFIDTPMIAASNNKQKERHYGRQCMWTLLDNWMQSAAQSNSPNKCSSLPWSKATHNANMLAKILQGHHHAHHLQLKIQDCAWPKVWLIASCQEHLTPASQLASISESTCSELVAIKSLHESVPTTALLLDSVLVIYLGLFTPVPDTTTDDARPW